MKGNELTREQFAELLRTAGAEDVSPDATDEMMDVVSNYALYISRYAFQVATHSGRRNVEATDVKLAAMNVTLGAGRLAGGVVEAGIPHERGREA